MKKTVDVQNPTLLAQGL
ncbi:hypothetical protein Gotri_000198 [Gossypium trilobum]|uniref:Uncharacterized protein n=1 Tax=Gossypium trilobum TaxID=34281 RepID=A0A7J9FRH9_9ROSI|nr:hypothetical protein [Gossypium trilobum]